MTLRSYRVSDLRPVDGVGSPTEIKQSRDHGPIPTMVPD